MATETIGIRRLADGETLPSVGPCEQTSNLPASRFGRQGWQIKITTGPLGVRVAAHGPFESFAAALDAPFICLFGTWEDIVAATDGERRNRDDSSLDEWLSRRIREMIPEAFGI